MREIKFRAYHRKFKEWHYFSLVNLINMENSEQVANGRYFYAKFLDYENWCKFVGSKDKNGKEIYEGDIFDGHDGIERPIKGTIEYKPEWGRMVIDEDLTLTFGIARKGKIIGNIYENPELLAVEREGK